MIQQIVDGNGILKHIIFSAHTNDQTPKNQILTNQMTKNGAKLIPVNGSTTRPNSFFSSKRKKPLNDTFNKTSITNLNEGFNSASLLNSNNLVYPLCCCCCPDCQSVSKNHQLNSISSTSFLNTEPNYIKPTKNFNSTTSSCNNKMVSNTYPKRQNISSTPSILSNKNNNRENKIEKRENHKDIINQISQKNYNTGVNNNSINSNKNSKISGNSKNINSNNNYSSYHNNLNNQNSSNNYPVKSALLSTKQICKECIQQDQQYALNQKYLYPPSSSYTHNSLSLANNNNTINKNKYNQTNINQFANTYQIMNKKFTYASDTKQLNKNRTLPSFSLPSRTNSTHLINFTPGILNVKSNNQKQLINNHKKDKNESYSELISYASSNHLSAFKSPKRIDTNSCIPNNKNIIQEDIKEHRSNSVTASSSPVSDFSSEESEQTNYKHTTLLNYPPPNYSATQYLTNLNSSNYSNNYQSNFNNHSYNGYNYSNNFPTDSSTNSLFISSNNRKNHYQFKTKKVNCDNLQVNDKNPINLFKNDKNSIESKLNEIESDDLIKISSNERDDGFEGDDYDKSYDELIEEQSFIENEAKEINVNDAEKDECDIKTSINNDGQENCESIMSEKNERSVVQENNNLEEDNKENDNIEEINDQNNNTITKNNHIIFNNEELVKKEKDKMRDENSSPVQKSKLLDENSNEIGINEHETKEIEDQKVELKSTDYDFDSSRNLSPERLGKNSITTGENILEDNLNLKSTIQDNEMEPMQTTEQKIIDRTQIKKKSEQIKIVTFSLSYTKLTGNCVKLKWTVLNNGNNLFSIAKENQFMVEMIYSKEDKQIEDQNGGKASRIVYQGLIKHCKIQCLKPLCEYSFRVKCYVNNHQLISNLLTITTPELQVQPLITKKRTSKHNIQFNLQHQQLLKQQLLIEQKQKELELQQKRQQNELVNKKSDQSLTMILCAFYNLFKKNFAYLLICFFLILAIFSAIFLSDLLN